MFRLEWHRSATNELVLGWTAGDADERKAITQAIDDLERQLKRDPEHCGESRSGNRRIVLSPPVALTYEVLPRLSLVTVLQVRFYGRRQK